MLRVNPSFKKYIDDLVAAAIVAANAYTDAEVAAAIVTANAYTDAEVAAAIAAYVTLSAYTDEDSDNNVMLKAHAYKAQSDGDVCAKVISSAGEVDLRAYVGLTNDPVGAGIQVQNNFTVTTTYGVDVTFPVAKDEYFELLTTSSNAVNIYWKSHGTLEKPVDFN